MDDLAKLRALAERLEKATEPDRELDAAIWWLFDRSPAERLYWNASIGTPRDLGDELPPKGLGWAAVIGGSSKFTASIDAALALVERLFPGVEYEITTMYGVARVALPLNDSAIGPSYGSDEAGNAPLAILRAVVAAMIAKESAHG